VLDDSRLISLKYVLSSDTHCSTSLGRLTEFIDDVCDRMLFDDFFLCWGEVNHRE
jgi:hypothetical protein